MTVEDQVESVKEKIDDIFSDVSVSQDETFEWLEELKQYIMELQDTLEVE